MFSIDVSTAGRGMFRQSLSIGQFRPRRIPLLLSDGAMLAILFLCPLLVGGRHPVGRLMYVSTVALLTVATLLARSVGKNQRWRLSGMEWLLAFGAALLILQITPLPGGLLSRLSPGLTQHLTLWNQHGTGVVQMGTWNQLSVMPHATREALSVYIAHALLFVVVLQRIDRLSDVQWLLRMISLAVTSLAVIALMQYLSGTEKYLWVFTHSTRLASHAVSGPFVNPNHLAHFLALGVGPLIWWMSENWRKLGGQKVGPTGNLFRGQPADQRAQSAVIVLGIACAVVALTTILTSSRGGVIVLVLAAATSVLLLAYRGLASRRALLALGLVAAMTLVGIGVHGGDRVRDELATITTGSLDDIDSNQARRKLWKANLDVAAAFPLFGSGVGSHAETYKLFYSHPSNVEYTHAENVYLQLLSETGIVGLGFVLVGLAVAGRWTWRTVRLAPAPPVQAAAAALTAILVVSVTHGLFDFPWYLPSCMSIAIIALAALCRLSTELNSQKSGGQGSADTFQLSRRAWLGVALVTAVMLGILVSYWVPPARASFAWNRYLQLSLQRHATDQIAKPEAKQRPGWNRRAAQENRDKRMFAELHEVLRLDPNNDRANLRMASVCLRIFERAQRDSENPMALSQIRDAALASNFTSLDALNDWVTKVVGDNRSYLDTALLHARRGAALSPLSGRNYLYLSELAFLEGVGSQGIGQLVSQAAEVRPYDAAVLFAMGKEQALLGDVEGALGFWKQSFHQSEDYRELIIRRLAGQMPARDFLRIFNPDSRTLKALMAYYLEIGRLDQVAVVAPDAAEVIEREADELDGLAAVRCWHRALAVHKLVGNADKAIECARKAVQAAPNHYNARYRLAEQLLSQQQYTEGLEHLRWCLNRRPYDGQLKKRLRYYTAMQCPDASTAKLPTSPQTHSEKR